MKIGIIGAGHIGGTLTRRLTALGHEVSIANSRGPQTLADLARETGAKPVTVEQAAHAGEVVIVTIPEKNIVRLPAGLFDGVPADVRRQAIETLGVLEHRRIAARFHVMQDGGNRLLDGRIGGIVELQQAGEARLEIRLRAIEAGERNHRILL